MSLLNAYIQNFFDEESQLYDAPNIANSLYTIEPGKISKGTLDNSFLYDQDVYRIELSQHYRYEIKMTSDANLYGWNSYRNSNLIEFDLVDSYGNIIDSSSPTLLYDDELSYYSSSNTTLYIKIHGFDYSPADYAITVEEIYEGPPNNQAIYYTTGFSHYGDSDGKLEVGEQLSFGIYNVVDLDGIASGPIESWVTSDGSVLKNITDWIDSFPRINNDSKKRSGWNEYCC